VRNDDLLKESPQFAPMRPAVGIGPQLSDAELVALAVLQALLGFTSEVREGCCEQVFYLRDGERDHARVARRGCPVVTGGGAWASVRSLSWAAVTAQVARGAMTRTACRWVGESFVDRRRRPSRPRRDHRDGLSIPATHEHQAPPGSAGPVSST
jgi:hypothetical protein